MNQTYTKITREHQQFLKELLGERCLDREEVLEAYGQDQTEDFIFLPELVLKPETTEEVSHILRYCNEQSICVTPSGARTGLSGGALPVCGGVVVTLERMNKILEIDVNNHQVCTEPGVVTQVLQDAVKELGLYYPPDPASKGSCFIGGNISENSGGPKALKYGVTKDYVLNLEVVLPNGEIIWTGANVLKNSTGYNLTQLLVGSEGTLAIVTKIVLKLIPHPTCDLSILVPFYNGTDACKAVAEIFKAGITPSALEFMERDAIIYTQQQLNDFSLVLEEDHEAHLLIEVDGFNLENLYLEIEKISAVLEQFKVGEMLMAENESQKAKLWNLRRKVGEAVKSFSVYKEEDTVVPRFRLPELLQEVKRLGKEYGFHSVCYGHAGDGNLHVNILKGGMSDEDWGSKLPEAIEHLFHYVVALGGTISGEHGIGYVQKRYMHTAFSDFHLDLMKKIKDSFDPKGILNPGKIFPDKEE